MLQKKICMLGSYGVGKTSLVRRFVESLFEEKYQTTVGVKIDKKIVQAGATALTLIIWDLAGEDEIEKIRLSHLRGASGYILVVDGCRKSTLERATGLKARVEETVGAIPCVMAVNKADLRDQWDLDPRAAEEFGGHTVPVLLTSAKTGEGVERVFELLAAKMLLEP